MKSIICLLVYFAVAYGNSDLEGSLFKANERLTSEALNVAVAANPGSNVVLSGFSLLQPLGQLSLAAAGPTHDELLNALGQKDDVAVKEVFAKLYEKIQSVKGVEFKLASKIYVQSGIQLNQDIVQESNKTFGSEVQNIEFVPASVAAAEINGWVQNKTNNHVKNLVDPNSLSSDTVTVLLNTLYFKGEWIKPFDKKLTSISNFTVSPSRIIKVPSMNRLGWFSHGTNSVLDAQLLELYYKGNETSFLVVLPNKVDGLPALLEKLKNPGLLNDADLTVKLVSVYLPRFKAETTTNLKDVLSAVGVKKVFDRHEANLTRLLQANTNSERLYITNAIQKAFIDVNEAGTEASAANEAEISLASAKESLVVQFKADHPFVFYLKYKGKPLFNGVVVEP